MSDNPETEAAASEPQRTVAAFVLTLIAGLWFLLGSLVMFGGYRTGPMYGEGGQYMNGGYGHMGGGYGHMGGGGSSMMHWLWHDSMVSGMGWLHFNPYFDIVSGIVLILAAGFLYVRPEQRASWGVLILVVSALGLFLGMGGFVAGIIGLIGGLIAVTRPSLPK